VEPLRVLDEVDAEEERIAGSELPGQGPQEGRHPIGVQVADRPREEEGQPAASRPQGGKVLEEVPNDAVDIEARVVGIELVHRIDEEAFADVQQHAALQQPAAPHGLEDQPDFAPHP
jgi:hypothetical protein